MEKTFTGFAIRYHRHTTGTGNFCNGLVVDQSSGSLFLAPWTLLEKFRQSQPGNPFSTAIRRRQHPNQCFGSGSAPWLVLSAAHGSHQGVKTPIWMVYWISLEKTALCGALWVCFWTAMQVTGAKPLSGPASIVGRLQLRHYQYLLLDPSCRHHLLACGTWGLPHHGHPVHHRHHIL